MIPRREDIDSPIEEFIRKLGRDPEPSGRILAIEDREIDLEFFLKWFEVLADDCTAGFADRVADKQNFHAEKVKTPQQACGSPYLNLFTQVGALAAL